MCISGRQRKALLLPRKLVLSDGKVEAAEQPLWPRLTQFINHWSIYSYVVDMKELAVGLSVDLPVTVQDAACWDFPPHHLSRLD